MNKNHSSGKEKHNHDTHSRYARKKLHQKWILWGVVGLMLASMLIYVLTMNESDVPDIQPSNPPPAAANP